MTICRVASVAGLILGLLALLGAQAGLIEPPLVSLLKISGPAGRKLPVQFSHKAHDARQVGCTQCHHDYQGKRNVWRQGQPVQKCQACHGLTPKAGRLDAKNAFHRQCKGCHLRLKQQGRPAGPVECRGCHRSQSSRFNVQRLKFLTFNFEPRTLNFEPRSVGICA